MKCLIVFLLYFLCNVPGFCVEEIEAFFNKHPLPIYQDINIRNRIVALGTDLCSVRYDIIKPIFDGYDRPFTVLDVGAAQGYFSFSIAHDYLQSFCVMVDANTPYCEHHEDILYDLCLLNNDLDNVIYLNKKMTLADLLFLNKEEHFDVIMAFLVVHMMEDSLQQQIKVIESLLTLGDNLIIEVANDIAVPFSSYVEFLSTKMDCQYLGEVPRHRKESCPYVGKGYHSCPCIGKIFWFKMKKSVPFETLEKPVTGVKKETFLKLNGVYPTTRNLFKRQKR